MNYKNEKGKFDHVQKLLVKRRMIKSVTFEGACVKVYLWSCLFSLPKFCALSCLHEKVFPNLSYVHSLQHYRTNEVQKVSCSKGKVLLKIAVCSSSFLVKKELFYKTFLLIFLNTSFDGLTRVLRWLIRGFINSHSIIYMFLIKLKLIYIKLHIWYVLA